MGNAAPCVVTWLATVVVALLAGRAAEAVRLDAVFRRLWDAADNGHKCQPEQVRFLAASPPVGLIYHAQPDGIRLLSGCGSAELWTSSLLLRAHADLMPQLHALVNGIAPVWSCCPRRLQRQRQLSIVLLSLCQPRSVPWQPTAWQHHGSSSVVRLVSSRSPAHVRRAAGLFRVARMA